MRKELVSLRDEDQSMVAATVNEHKESVRKFLIIRDDGKGEYVLAWMDLTLLM